MIQRHFKDVKDFRGALGPVALLVASLNVRATNAMTETMLKLFYAQHR